MSGLIQHTGSQSATYDSEWVQAALCEAVPLVLKQDGIAAVGFSCQYCLQSGARCFIGHLLPVSDAEARKMRGAISVSEEPLKALGLVDELFREGYEELGMPSLDALQRMHDVAVSNTVHTPHDERLSAFRDDFVRRVKEFCSIWNFDEPDIVKNWEYTT